MKKVVQILASLLLCLSFAGGVASAQEVENPCDGQGNFTIVNTGPESNNQITCSDETVVNFTCVNGVIVNDVNDQTGSTGAASVGINTQGGNATSGSVLNENESSTDINSSCASSTPANPSNPTPTVVAQAEKKPAAPQAQAPKGAVEAGAGGASKADNTAAALGLAASIGAVIGGVALVRKFAE